MSAGDLDSRIAGVLQRKAAAPDDIAALLAEVEASLVRVGDELSRARAEAFDPISTSAVIASARGTIFECEFRLQRLVEARDRLREKHAAAVERVAKEAREAEYAAISAERDRVSERLAEVYPRAAGEIAEVLAEAVKSTRRVAAWNAQAAGPWIAEPPQLQRGVRLPPERVGEAAFWPPLDRVDVEAMVPQPLRQLEEAVANEAREATRISSGLEAANQLQKQARRKVLAGSW